MKKLLCFILSITIVLSMFTSVYGLNYDYTVSANSFDKIIGSDETGEIFCVRNGEKYGYVDKNGKVILDFVYDYAKEFSCGLAYVKKDEKSAFIDKSGNVIIDLKASNFDILESTRYGIDGEDYFRSDKFYDGYAVIGCNGFELLIDKKCNQIECPDGLTFQDFNIVDSMAVVGKVNCWLYGYLNLKTMEYDIRYFPLYEFKDGIGLATGTDGFVRLVDENLNATIIGIYCGDDSFVSYNNGYINFYTNDDNWNIAESSLYDLSANLIFSSEEYIYLGDYSDNLICFKAKKGNNLYGYMDINGNITINPSFKKAGDFNNGLAIVSEDYDIENDKGTFGVIDKQGNYVIEPSFDNIIADQTSHVMYCLKNDKWSIISLIADKPSEWAEKEVQMAIDSKLIPENLQCNYIENITREDFCKLTISLVEAKLGKNIDEILTEKQLTIDDNPFTDTTSKTIIAANKLGIVNGKGNGIFEPNGFITRQEAAVMLTNVAKTLNVDITANDSTFADNSKIANWAKTSVNYVADKEIMKGTGNGFEPLSTYTRQQAYLTILRLFSLIL